jgi:hypothetical protein
VMLLVLLLSSNITIRRDWGLSRMDLRISSLVGMDLLGCGQMMHRWVCVWLIVCCLMILLSILHIFGIFSSYGYSMDSIMVAGLILSVWEEISLSL